MRKTYTPVPWPEYQLVMEEKWAQEDNYYDSYDDVYLVPADKYEEFKQQNNKSWDQLKNKYIL